MIRGFGDEIVSRPEVLVEAAMGEAGRLHDLGDTGATEAFLTNPRRRQFDDPLVRPGRRSGSPSAPF
jgi:hypothetical protein